MEEIDTAINLTEQLLEQAEIDDKERKIKALEDHRGTAATGEGYWPFHLKKLLNLLEKSKGD